MKSMNKHNIISNKQYSFQENKSTTLGIFDLYPKIIKALDNGDYACSVFSDFGKDFDTVYHEILVKKIENYGVREILNKWLISYLRNRCQVKNYQMPDPKKYLQHVEFCKAVY